MTVWNASLTHPTQLTNSHVASIVVKCWRYKIPDIVPHFKNVMVVCESYRHKQFSIITILQGPVVGREETEMEIGRWGIVCSAMGVTVLL